MLLSEFRIMVVERVVENMHSTGLRGHYTTVKSTIYHGYGCIAAEKNNKRHDFNVDMSVNFKSTTVFVCTGEIRIKYTRKPYFIRKIYSSLKVRNLQRFCGFKL